jgi:hypothetical protein
MRNCADANGYHCFVLIMIIGHVVVVVVVVAAVVAVVVAPPPLRSSSRHACPTSVFVAVGDPTRQAMQVQLVLASTPSSASASAQSSAGGRASSAGDAANAANAAVAQKDGGGDPTDWPRGDDEVLAFLRRVSCAGWGGAGEALAAAFRPPARMRVLWMERSAPLRV